MNVETDSPEAVAQVEALWRGIKGSAFEDGVRKRFGIDDTWKVEVEVSGGGQVQIGDYTWDSVPYKFEVSAIQQKLVWVRDRYRGVLRPTLSSDFNSRKTYEAESLPEIWSWMEETP